MRIPAFSRQATTDTTETTARPAAASTTRTGHDPVRARSADATTEVRTRPGDDATGVRVRRDADTLTDLPPVPKAAGRTSPPSPPAAVRRNPDAVVDRPVGQDHEQAARPAGPKPRASLLATLGLVLGVASVLLVLSGPLLGYGIGLAVLGLGLSLCGIHATGRRHVAGKTDALLGMMLSLGAIVLGVLALTGSLSWLGTDTQPVNNLRDWLDARFVDRF